MGGKYLDIETIVDVEGALEVGVEVKFVEKLFVMLKLNFVEVVKLVKFIIEVLVDEFVLKIVLVMLKETVVLLCEVDLLKLDVLMLLNCLVVETFIFVVLLLNEVTVVLKFICVEFLELIVKILWEEKGEELNDLVKLETFALFVVKGKTLDVFRKGNVVLKLLLNELKIVELDELFKLVVEVLTWVVKNVEKRLPVVINVPVEDLNVLTGLRIVTVVDWEVLGVIVVDIIGLVVLLVERKVEIIVEAVVGLIANEILEPDTNLFSMPWYERFPKKHYRKL